MKFNFFTTTVTSIIIIMTVCNSCGHSDIMGNDEVKDVVDSFAVAYFNFHYDKAIKYVTNPSARWIHFSASNVTQKDINILKSKEYDASIEIKDMTNDGDSLYHVSVMVCNYLPANIISKQEHIVDKDTYIFDTVKEHGKWKIRMASPPRSEKRNHD